MGWCAGSAESLVATRPVPKLLWAIFLLVSIVLILGITFRHELLSPLALKTGLTEGDRIAVASCLLSLARSPCDHLSGTSIL